MSIIDEAVDNLVTGDYRGNKVKSELLQDLVHAALMRAKIPETPDVRYRNADTEACAKGIRDLFKSVF